MVRVARLERAASTSQMWRPTNWATPGYSISVIIPRRERKSKIFLSVVIYVVKAVLLPGFVVEGNPANARVTRGSGLRLFPSWIDGATLPNQLRYSSGSSRDTKEYFQEITCPTVRVQSISMQPRDSTYLIRFPPSLQEGNLQQAL